jgi:hypothetical protein
LHIETVLLFSGAGEMGKEGNWFSAVKRAFHSPSKDKDTEKSEPKDPDLLVDIYRVAAVSSLSPTFEYLSEEILHAYRHSI